jgi:hypothetical protein
MAATEPPAHQGADGPSPSSPRRRPRWRRVIFSSWRARLSWAGGALLLGIAGYWLAAPAFSDVPSQPRAWGLWVSTNVDHDRSGIQSWLLNLNVDAAGGCQQPAVVDGELDAGNASGEPASFTQTADIAVSASFARVMSVSVASGGDGRASGFSQPALGGRPRWSPLHLVRFRDVYIAAGSVRFVGGTAAFRMRVAATTPAGYGACYLSSPSLFEYPGADTYLWNDAEGQADVYFSNDRRVTPRLDYAPLTDSIIHLEVDREEPDRGAVDAGGEVADGTVQLTCTGAIPSIPRRAAKQDAFLYERQLVAQSNCSSVQTFRASNAASLLNARIFAAGILLSAATGMLLEALVLGSTADIEAREPRRDSRADTASS